MTVRHMIYHNDPQSLPINLIIVIYKTSHDHHVTQLMAEFARFSE